MQPSSRRSGRPFRSGRPEEAVTATPEEMASLEEMVALDKVQQAATHMGAARALAEAFKECMFPDPGNWAWEHVGEVHAFTRGIKKNNFVTHGTPLSLAYRILREGIRVGDGHHKKNNGTMHGVFCIAGGSVKNRIANARDRSTSSRCTEFQKINWPCGWTVPCVLAWEPWPDTEVSYLEAFADGCWKSCLPGSIGDCREMPYNVSVFVHSGELQSYTSLQELHESGAHSHTMVCGGRTWWDAHEERHDNALYWSEDTNNMPPSCGRSVPVAGLGAAGWKKTPSKLWFCRSCSANHCSVLYWS